MRTIRLNDGTELSGRVMDNGDGIMIFVYIDNMSIAEGVAIFSDAERVGHIVASDFGHDNVYDGYTEIYSVSHAYGNCNLVMKKG